ncbi:glycosyltransferase [Hymenobacter nivis]|uniref:Glycosyltransferase n=2 Tax=Hymenobacter nivis TaxID=1850093 RepID=A0A502GU71_9BACT|nr:glycosyltransferase [Hymenobacter nivis]
MAPATPPPFDADELISIVVPLYNEAQSVRTLASQIVEVMETHGFRYELILVNDGSADQTWGHISALAAANPHIIGLDMAGNYGQTLGLRAGFEQAQGSIVVAMDGDLQHDPAYLPEFVRLIRAGYDMVGGAKSKRPEGFLKTLISNGAHNIISRLSGVKLEYFGATYKAYRRYLLTNVEMLGDAHRFLGALVARKGVRYIEFPIEIRAREFGTSNYGLNKVFKVIVDLLILRFTVVYARKPFRLFGVLGILSLLIGGALTTGFLIGSVFFGVNIADRFPMEFIFSLFLIMGGIFLLSFGVLAEIGTYTYFARRNRRPYVLRHLAHHAAGAPAAAMGPMPAAIAAAASAIK